MAADDQDPPAAAGKVSFHKEIRPILRKHCQGCHQPAKAQGEYELVSFAGLLKGGQSQLAAVVPGNPDESFLLDQIEPSGDTAEMPKDQPPLARAEIDLISRWIAEGAGDDSPPRDGPLIDADHPPVYVSTPVVTSLDYSPDGNLLAVSGYHEVLLHQADGSAIAARLVGLSERIESAIFSPDGKYLAVTGGSPARFGEVQVWEVEKRELALSLPVTFDTIYGASWSADGRLIAFGCADKSVRAIEAATGKQVLFQGAHNDWVLDTVFSKSATHLISVSRDMSMKLIEVATERFIDNITSITPGALKGGLISVDRRPNEEQVVVGGADGMPKLFRIFRPMDKPRQIGDDFNLIRNFDPLPGRVYAVRFNKDGSRIAAASSLNGTGEVRIYETETGRLVSRHEAKSGMYAIAFHPTEPKVAASGFDGLVRLIDAETGALIREFSSVPMASAADAAP
jgi:hypothetical protein